MDTTIANCYRRGNSKFGMSQAVADCYPLAMPTIREIRRTNLNTLISRYKTKAEFAGVCDLSAGHVSQMANGHRNIGDAVARRIEERLDLQNGWLDRQHGAPLDEVELELGPDIGSLLRAPLVGTAQLGMDGFWTEIEYPAGHGDGYLLVPSRDPNAYTLRVRGNSMHPAIRDGWLVVVEPNQDLIPSEYVLIKLRDGRKTIKTFLYQRGDVIGVQSVRDDEVHQIWLDEIEEDRGLQYVGGVYPPSRLTLG